MSRFVGRGRSFRLPMTPSSPYRFLLPCDLQQPVERHVMPHASTSLCMQKRCILAHIDPSTVGPKTWEREVQLADELRRRGDWEGTSIQYGDACDSASRPVLDASLPGSVLQPPTLLVRNIRLPDRSPATGRGARHVFSFRQMPGLSIL